MLTSALAVWALGIPAAVTALAGLMGWRRRRTLTRLIARDQAIPLIRLLGAAVLTSRMRHGSTSARPRGSVRIAGLISRDSRSAQLYGQELRETSRPWQRHRSQRDHSARKMKFDDKPANCARACVRDALPRKPGEGRFGERLMRPCRFYIARQRNDL
jgi:hypothetical protein